MHRRAFLTVTTALFFTPAARAADKAETKTIPAEKLFPFLSNYYALPPAERSQFHLAYGLMVKGAKPDQISLTLIDGARQIRITSDAQGYLAPLPTAAQLKSNLTYSRPAGAKFGVSLDVIPNQAPAQTMDARNLAIAVSQAFNGARKLAGIVAIAMPTLDRIAIRGVTSAQVKLTNGETRPLPFVSARTDKSGNTQPAHAVFIPAQWPAAVTLSFNTAPSRLLITSRD